MGSPCYLLPDPFPAMLRLVPLALSWLLILALAPLDLATAAEPETAASPASEPPVPSPLALLRQIDQGFIQVFEKVSPSVVVVEVTKKPSPIDEGADRAFEFFNEDLGKEGRRDSSRQFRLPQQPNRSEGSGFIFQADGHILTNLHVVADAEKLMIRTKDGRVFTGQVVGTDDKTDIAVLKIDATGLLPAEMGDSDALRVGQLVCAIGTPYNQDYSFTCGWVSGKGRTNLLGPSSPTILYEDYIQTDAFINPGNSGGPLFDVEGRVVGMNTLINGYGRGLAFAIPSNILQQISQKLITEGKVVRPWLGIRIETLGQNPALRERISGVDKGVVVDTIEANAPAYKSDLRPADIITEVDAVAIGSAHDLQKEILKKSVGQTVYLTVWRNGQTMYLPVIAGELPSEYSKLVATPGSKRMTPAVTDYGLKLKDARPTGAQIVEITPDSAAASSDLQPEDIITEVENQVVADAASCFSAIQTAGEKSGRRGVLLNVERKGKRTYAVLNIAG